MSALFSKFIFVDLNDSKLMLTLFTSPVHGQLLFNPGLPAGFKGPFLAGSRPFYFSEDFGLVVVQELTTDHFTLQLYFFHFLKKITLVRLLPEGLHSFFVRNGEAGWRQKTKIRLKAGQFLLCAGPASNWQVDLSRETPVELFHASFGEQMRGELLPGFPSYESFLNTGDKRVMTPAMSANAAIRDALHQMLFARYEAYKLPFFFKTKVAEYFFQQLHQASELPDTSRMQPTEWEREAMFRIRDFILSDVSQHYPITELARRFKVSPLHLKVFFKREFGVGPFTFLLNARLDKVKELMEGGMPMKEAAPLAGYQITSFITAFKRRYGYPPGAIFRRKKKD